MISPTPLVRRAGDELAGAAERAIDLARASRSANTRRAYAGDWDRFTAWCDGRGLEPLPASPATIGLFIADLSAGPEGLAVSTIERMLAGITAAHRAKGLVLDRRHPGITAVLDGLRRERRKKGRGRAAPLLPGLLTQILDACGDDLRSKRDRALLLLGFTAALRRSELVAIDREHISETKEGLLLVLPRSKGDQEGEGATIGIPRGQGRLCPVAAVKAWLAAADIEAGPIFRRINKWGTLELDRLTAQSVRLIVKRRALAADVPAPVLDRLSGHSLRAGFITAAYAKDVPEHATQKHARHKKAETTRSYNREASAFKLNPAVGLLDAD